MVSVSSSREAQQSSAQGQSDQQKAIQSVQQSIPQCVQQHQNDAMCQTGRIDKDITSSSSLSILSNRIQGSSKKQNQQQQQVASRRGRQARSPIDQQQQLHNRNIDNKTINMANNSNLDGAVRQNQTSGRAIRDDDRLENDKKNKNKRRFSNKRPNNNKLEKQMNNLEIQPNADKVQNLSDDMHEENEKMESIPQEKLKTEPLITSDFQTEYDQSLFTLDFIRNNKNELFIIIRHQVPDQNAFRRVAIPFAMAETFISKIADSLSLLDQHGVTAILENINSNDVSFLNIFQESSGFSNYYIDFMKTQNGDDVSIVLKLSEKKLLSKSKIRKSYELFISFSDIAQLHRELVAFYEICCSYMNSETYNDLPPKLLRCGNLSLEWIIRSDMNMFLKVYKNKERLFYPIKICRSIQSIIKKIIDLYDHCGTNFEAYFPAIQEDRKAINRGRLDRGLEALPELNSDNFRKNVDNYSQNRSNKDNSNQELISGDSDGANNSEPHVPKNQILYSTRINSAENYRSYHFDLVLNSETQEVKFRLVELIRNAKNRQTNFSNKKNQSNVVSNRPQDRHTLMIPISMLTDFANTFDKMVNSIPLPPEEAFFSPKMRCFVRFMVRPMKGLVLRIKAQQALGPNDAQQQNQQLPLSPAALQGENHDNNGSMDGNTNDQTPAIVSSTTLSKGPNRFGKTETIELPVHMVHRIYNYLSANCPF